MSSGVCAVCGCTDARACPGGCVWANPTATLCSQCVERDEPLVALPHELGLRTTDSEGFAHTHRGNLEAALELGGFEGGVLPTTQGLGLPPPGTLDGLLVSRATLPNGRPVVLTWDQGDCLDCVDADTRERIDLLFVLGREAAEQWLSERTEDELIPTLDDELTDFGPHGTLDPQFSYPR